MKLGHYTKIRYAIGLEPYIQSLLNHEIIEKRSIIDIGCGPGHWTLAAATLNEDARVIGIDINQELLNYARYHAEFYDIRNCEIMNYSYNDILEKFGPNSFDVIMCNSVIQYIDESDALAIFSKTLVKNGIILMFYNHDRGYYLKNLLGSMKRFDLISIIYNFLIFINVYRYIAPICVKKYPQHYVSLRSLKKISSKLDLELVKIENKPTLEYADRFLGCSCVFSCKLIKR